MELSNSLKIIKPSYQNIIKTNTLEKSEKITKIQKKISEVPKLLTVPANELKERFEASISKSKRFIQKGLQVDCERGVAISCSTGRILTQAIGDAHSVRICVPAGIKHIKIHGHPRHLLSTGEEITANFSKQDILSFVKSNDCAETWIMDFYGNFNKIKKTPNSCNVKWADIQNYFISKEGTDDFINNPNFIRDLCKRFGFEYEEGFSSINNNLSSTKINYIESNVKNFSNS